MRITRLYCPELSEHDETFSLSDKAHRHAVQVLRLKQGSQLQLFDGRGLEYEAVLEQVTKRSSAVSLGEKCVVNNESPLEITLLQGISRGERMDYAVQKAVELGVNRIVPVITERCNVQLAGDRADKRLTHWRGVMISACEQSGRSILPELSDVMSLQQALVCDNDVQCRIVLDPQATSGFTALQQQNKIVLLIGSEGGLTEQEVQQAIAANFQPVKFGSRILRTETATVAALAAVQTLWGDLG